MPETQPTLSPFWRMMPTLSAVAAVVLLVIGGLVTAYSERSYREQVVREAQTQAQILGSVATAALVFNDRNAAQEYVRALAANPQITAAALYDSTGALFASYSRFSNRPLPMRAELRDPYFDDDRVVVWRAVLQNGATVGAVYLRTLVEPFQARLPRYGGIALLIINAALMLVATGAAQRALTRANRILRERAAELAESNRNLQNQIAEREKAEAALRQAQKMETIGQLTGGVAHDFNNLLTIILGNLERLQRRIAGKEELADIKRIAGNATRGAERAAALTKSLLAFSRRQPLDPRPVDANKLVANMSELLRRTLGEQVTIENVSAAGLWRTQVDPNQLESAILNLAVNARDAMPQGGKLTIETANAHFDARYANEADVAPGQYVAICVTDTGTGMSQDVIDRAFEPFFTTKDVGAGTGLGLSQVYGFVRQSGGHVRIYSEPGEGTTVKIYLPRLLADELEGELPRQLAMLTGGSSTETVLIVEDDDGVRDYSAAILKELGYRVLEAAHGRGGLELLDRHPEITLLFTDVGLPGGMNGRQLADEARKRRPELKVLFTTGYARNAIVHDGRLDPGVQLITKPFTFAELATMIRQTLDKA